MKAFVLCAALAAALAPAFADDLIARDGDDSVRLADTPCASKVVLEKVEPTSREEFKAASAVVQGQNFVACWREMGAAAYLIYEDGDQGVIPLRDLKRELAA